MTERVRTTISLDPEVLDVFRRMAEASNTSVSRCMGDWLTDTADAARVIALQVEEAKRAPLAVLRDMKAVMAGITSQVSGQALARSGREDGRLAGGLGGVSLGNNTKSQAAIAQVNQPQTRMDRRFERFPERRESAAGAAVPPSSNTGVLVPPGPPSPIRPSNKKVGK